MSKTSPTETILCPRCKLTLPEPTRLYQQPSPFEQYLGTPILQNLSVSISALSNLKPYIEALQSDVATLDADITKLKAALQELEIQRDTASHYLHLHKGLVCRFHDLPTEILCQIFLYCLPNSDYEGSYDLFSKKRAHDGRRAPWDLTAVCRRWRDVGLSMPRLWSAPSFVVGDSEGKIHFDNGDYQWRSGQDCLRTALVRAGEEPFTLDIDMDSQEPFKWLSSVGDDTFRRVETLYLTGLPARFTHDRDLPRNVFPKLRKLGLTARFNALDIERAPYDPASEATLDWNMMLSLIAFSAPPHELALTIEIEDIGLSSEFIFLDPSAVSFSLEKLTIVTLRGGSLEAMVPFLCACPSLSTLSIYDIFVDDFEWSPNDSVIALPTLQSLNISDWSIHLSTNVLSSFQCPQLRHLAATSGYTPLSPAALQKILSRSQCPLQTLDILVQTSRNWKFTLSPQDQAIWRDVLPMLCHLKTLALHYENTSHMAWTLQPLTQPTALPLLCSLTVRIKESLDNVIIGESGRTSEALEIQEPSVETALEQFLDACVYKPDGGVLQSLNVTFLRPTDGRIDEQSALLRRKDSNLLARARHWKASGVHVVVAQRCTTAADGFEYLVR